VSATALEHVVDKYGPSDRCRIEGDLGPDCHICRIRGHKIDGGEARHNAHCALPIRIVEVRGVVNRVRVPSHAGRQRNRIFLREEEEILRHSPPRISASPLHIGTSAPQRLGASRRGEVESPDASFGQSPVPFAQKRQRRSLMSSGSVR